MYGVRLQRPGPSPSWRCLAVLEPAAAGAASVPVAVRSWPSLCWRNRWSTALLSFFFFQPCYVDPAALAAQQGELGLSKAQLTDVGTVKAMLMILFGSWTEVVLLLANCEWWEQAGISISIQSPPESRDLRNNKFPNPPLSGNGNKNITKIFGINLSLKSSTKISPRQT